MSEVLPNEKVVNDFSMTVATVNGSGSATSNLTIFRAIFRMGIPVSGKNLFPSNIKGQPTWFTIRVSKDGYTARKDEDDIVIAMNVKTVAEDYRKVSPGGVFIYSDNLKVELDRDDITVYPVSVKKIIRETNSPTRLRKYMENMVYVGVIAELIKMDFEKILDPKAYIGRAPQQVDEFIRDVVTPVRKKYRKELTRKVELNV